MASKWRFKEILNRTEHKKPMDPEFLACMADLRRQTEGSSSTSSTPRASLYLLGSSDSIASSVFSESFSVASLPPVVEFPPTPVFTDQIPAEIMQELELLSVAPETPKTSASRISYLLQNSHLVSATQSLDTTHDEASSYTTSSNSNSTTRQQEKPVKPPVQTIRSVSHYTPPRQTPTPTTPLSDIAQQPMKLQAPTTRSVSHYTPPLQTPTPTTPLSDIAQLPSGLISASTTTPRTTNPLSPLPQSSNHSPPPIIPLEAQHHAPPPPNKANLKAWWNQFTLANPKRDSFKGRSIYSFFSSHKPINPHAQHSTPPIIQSLGNPLRRVCVMPVSNYP